MAAPNVGQGQYKPGRCIQNRNVAPVPLQTAVENRMKPMNRPSTAPKLQTAAQPILSSRAQFISVSFLTQPQDNKCP